MHDFRSSDTQVYFPSHVLSVFPSTKSLVSIKSSRYWPFPSLLPSNSSICALKSPRRIMSSPWFLISWTSSFKHLAISLFVSFDPFPVHQYTTATARGVPFTVPLIHICSRHST
ncbi:unnamed protein product, partial [Ixodes persulcatus]